MQLLNIYLLKLLEFFLIYLVIQLLLIFYQLPLYLLYYTIKYCFIYKTISIYKNFQFLYIAVLIVTDFNLFKHLFEAVFAS